LERAMSARWLRRKIWAGFVGVSFYKRDARLEDKHSPVAALNGQYRYGPYRPRYSPNIYWKIFDTKGITPPECTARPALGLGQLSGDDGGRVPRKGGWRDVLLGGGWWQGRVN
jgi:hypothetical protein